MGFSKILPIWQPVGFSTHIIAAKVSEKYGVLTSHTGTLDPMAEGVIIVLLGEERLKKHDYANWAKEYDFEVVFGLSTDTYDGLGMVTSFHEVDISEEAVEEVLGNLKGDYVQDVPPYSSIKVKGKPLHWFARNKKLSGLEIPRKVGKIHNLKLQDIYVKDFDHVVEEIRKKINLVTGDLRQEQIKTRWVQLRESVGKKRAILIAKIRVEMSRGMYVRSLSQDVAKELHTTGFVYSLVRTRNGDYSKQNSKTLEEVFGSDFKKDYDFVSKY